MKKYLLLMLAVAMPAAAQTPDTTYTVGADQPNSTYPHYFRLTRGSAFLGVVLQGADTPYAGSCRAVWCALVPSNASNGVGQSGGTFGSFSAAAHEVVRVWNSLHPGDTLATPIVVPPPVDTSHAIDSSYTTERILPNPAGSVTGYRVYHRDTLVGTAIQAPAGRWSAYPPGLSTAIGVWGTLRSASYALVHFYQHPVVVIPPTKTVDTVIVNHYDTVTVHDTIKTTITITKTVHDTVTVKIPCDTVVKPSGEPELPRYMSEMDAMLKSARASDTVTRQVFDLGPGMTVPVARKDSLGRYVCNNIVQFDSTGTKWEKPQYFPCPQAVIDAVKARSIQP